jgi:hypothetical protein
MDGGLAAVKGSAHKAQSKHPHKAAVEILLLLISSTTTTQREVSSRRNAVNKLNEINKQNLVTLSLLDSGSGIGKLRAHSFVPLNEPLGGYTDDS